MARLRLPALTVHQWVPTWDHASWGGKTGKSIPPKEFYLSSMPIGLLRSLSGVRPRTKEARRVQEPDAGYQRSHDDERLQKISRYLEYGYPLSSANSLDPHQHVELINPGWLPTAILVNVLAPSEIRPKGSASLKVKAAHLVKILKSKGGTEIEAPDDVDLNEDKELAPLEIIDGQHRLLAIDRLDDAPEEYEVPVVLFDNLSLEWQAYLFWVINVEPKKINTSLAFDLYPELRNQEWLEKGESIKIYQEHRSQELTEALWRHPKSAWRDRIELFGKRVEGHVSNAAAIRSLAATFVRAWPRKREDEDEFRRLGGLFGSVAKDGDSSFVIGWKRSQQAAYLIAVWSAVRHAVRGSKTPWAEALRGGQKAGDDDPAFFGGSSLLATDQGFRCVCFVFNAVSQVAHEDLNLSGWFTKAQSDPTVQAVDKCIEELQAKRNICAFLDAVADPLINKVDWRTSSAPNLSPTQHQVQAQYRGSSGYSALNRAALNALLKAKDPLVSGAATRVSQIVGWSDGK
jgi:DGQHR domain-containing protein